MKHYFITGTDTDCGKTYITAKLSAYVPQAAALKPVASGCIECDGQLFSEDAQRLHSVSGLSLDVINPWRFKSPISPHIAAQEEHKKLDIAEIAHYCLNVSLPHINHLFIEGAGGLMVPLNDEGTWIDFLKITKIPVILVVGMKLGCINHALLTAASLQQHKIECVGWIANCIDPNMVALNENLQTLKSRMTMPLLATVPFLGEIDSCCLDYFHIR